MPGEIRREAGQHTDHLRGRDAVDDQKVGDEIAGTAFGAGAGLGGAANGL